MVTEVSKILILRFSSFGDVTQCLSVPSKLAAHFASENSFISEKNNKIPVEIHWATRREFEPLLLGHPHIHKIWTLDRKLGLRGLLQLISQLKKEKFSHIYDAHNNLRSRLICWFLIPPLDLTRVFSPPELIRKSQKRWKRLLLFRFRINKYRMPFSGQRDLLEPLAAWGIDETLPPPPQIVLSPIVKSQIEKKLQDQKLEKFTVLAPSAAHTLKRWPMAHWKELVSLLPEEKFIILGGPEDVFLSELAEEYPTQVQNWAGKTSFAETVAVVAFARALISNDTGILHVAEQLGKQSLALMGPAPFGFPSRPSTQVLELNLACRPCSKHGQGPCVNDKFHQCLVDISPKMVLNAYLRMVKK